MIDPIPDDRPQYESVSLLWPDPVIAGLAISIACVFVSLIAEAFYFNARHNDAIAAGSAIRAENVAHIAANRAIIVDLIRRVEALEAGADE